MDSWLIRPSRRFGGVFIGCCILRMIVAPPLHFFFDPVASMGPSSVYVEGAGFSGFWFHLGLLQSIPNLGDHDFYCYSSGCLSIVMALMNVTMDSALETSFSVQSMWRSGNISRFDLVDSFLDRLLPTDESKDLLSLDRINILVTTIGEGVTVNTPGSLLELRELLIRTTWIPYVTGRELWIEDKDGGIHLDGAFSQALHPKCQYDLSIPLSLNTLDTYINTLNPSIGRQQVKRYWETGRQHGPLGRQRLVGPQEL